MTYDNFIKGKLLDLAIDEGARHGGVTNALAVAQVMANRVRAGWQGGDWRKVIADAPSFIGTYYDAPHPVDPRDVNFRTLLQRIDDVYNGVADRSYLSVVKGGFDGQRLHALYYCELDRVDSAWFKTTILGNPEEHPRVAQVGPVVFFA